MKVYYNEIDPYAAQWLRNLIDAGHIAPLNVAVGALLTIGGIVFRVFKVAA